MDSKSIKSNQGGIKLKVKIMWSANIINTDKSDGIIKVSVQYSKGSQNFVREYKPTADNATDDWLKKQILLQITELDKIDIASIENGIVDLDGVVLNELETEGRKYNRILQELKKLKSLVILGIITEDNQEIRDRQAILANTFKLEFLGDIIL
jgi:hypothetical protein